MPAPAVLTVSRVVGALSQQGRAVNHKRVERLMALHGIRGRCGRRRLRTTIRDPHARPATDLVNRCFDRQRLNELWVGDITYIPTGEGWLYMSSVLDACSRRLLGWSLAGHMRTELVADALAAAVGQRGGRHRIRGVVFHGDHGSQGGINRSSQHLDMEVDDGQTAWVDGDADGEAV